MPLEKALLVPTGKEFRSNSIGFRLEFLANSYNILMEVSKFIIVYFQNKNYISHTTTHI
jgi:hypothetical protein